MSFSNESGKPEVLPPPYQEIIFRLGEEGHDDQDNVHNHHPLFCEMTELKPNRKWGDEPEWRETARWVKFEEDVEEGGNRWSKPFVAALSLHSLMELRNSLLTGSILLEMDASNLMEVWSVVVDEWIKSGWVSSELRDALIAVLLQRHAHLNQRRIRASTSREDSTLKVRPFSGIFRNSSVNLLERADSGYGRERTVTQLSLAFSDTNQISSVNNLPGMATVASKPNMHFFKKLPPGVEAANIMIAELDFLTRPLYTFVRFHKSTYLGNLTEIPAPTRFIFVLLGPKTTAQQRYHEIGRTMGTLFSDELFQHAAFSAKDRKDILAGVDEFLGAATVLPPGEWDPKIRIEPPAKVQSHETRIQEKLKREGSVDKLDELERNGHMGKDEPEHGAGIRRTGKLCGGLIEDIKRKMPFYLSDFRDSLHIQCVASFIFLYFASMTPLITFGGLMSDLLQKRMGAVETILGRSLSGVIFGLTAGQPIVILGSTGPILVFETIMFNMCQLFGIEYLSFRVWIGLWAMLQLLVMVLLDLSSLVSYITRFTEECFAALVSAIFVYEAFKKLIHIAEEEPVHWNPHQSPDVNDQSHLCECFDFVKNESTPFSENFTKADCLSLSSSSAMVGVGCVPPVYVPDAFLLSVILFFGTFIFARILKDSKTSSFFPAKIRQFLSDFAVIISIAIFVGIDLALGIPTPKLSVPEKLEPTYSEREGSWLVAFFGQNPWWTALAAFIPGLLATILIFMDQQITAVIVNRKENRYKKGNGYHLDLLIVALLTGALSMLGMPWMIADTVLSLTHVVSLKMESEVAAPGERPTFLGVREQRVTNILVSIIIGVSIFMTSFLKVIPMPVLFGVFLFMGLNALNGLQFTDRLKLVFMPLKYQPDYSYLRHVKITRVHLFTLVQLLCLVFLWVLKSFQETAMLFPLMVGALVGVRKLLDFVFTQPELGYLDDIMPEQVKRTTEDSQKAVTLTDSSKDLNEGTHQPFIDGVIKIRLPNGNFLSIPTEKTEAHQKPEPLNFTQAVNKTGLWKNISSANLLGQIDENQADERETPTVIPSRWKRRDIHSVDEKESLSLSPVPDWPDEGLMEMRETPSSTSSLSRGDKSRNMNSTP